MRSNLERIGPIAPLMGVAFLAFSSAILRPNVARARHLYPELADRGIEARPIGDRTGTVTGGAYVVSVNGRRYECASGDKMPAGGGSVLYDPRDPGRCRDRRYVGELGPAEMWGLFFGIAFAIQAVVCFVVGYRYWRRWFDRRGLGAPE